jgi:hypothetical protein
MILTGVPNGINPLSVRPFNLSVSVIRITSGLAGTLLFAKEPDTLTIITAAMYTCGQASATAPLFSAYFDNLATGLGTYRAGRYTPSSDSAGLIVNTSTIGVLFDTPIVFDDLSDVYLITNGGGAGLNSTSWSVTIGGYRADKRIITYPRTTRLAPAAF